MEDGRVGYKNFFIYFLINILILIINKLVMYGTSTCTYICRKGSA